MTYRNPRLLALAEGEACVLCGAQDGTVVSAHINSQKFGKGMGTKAHDAASAWICARCHSEIDQGKDLSKEERYVRMLEAIVKTHCHLWQSEKVRIK